MKGTLRMTDEDARLLRQTFDIARRAETKGNMPFGALLAGPDGCFPGGAAFWWSGQLSLVSAGAVCFWKAVFSNLVDFSKRQRNSSVAIHFCRVHDI